MVNEQYRLIPLNRKLARLGALVLAGMAAWGGITTAGDLRPPPARSCAARYAA